MTDGGGVWIGSGDGPKVGISRLSGGSTRPRRGGRPRRGATCTAAAAAVAIVLSCTVGGNGECSVNPISESKCSVEMQIFQTNGNGASTVVPAGQCVGTSCQCTPPYKGPSCSVLGRAAAPRQFSVDQTLGFQGQRGGSTPTEFVDVTNFYDAYDGQFFKSWQFLAKTCWAGTTDGTLRLQLEYNVMSCGNTLPGGNISKGCQVDNPSNWNSYNEIPRIAFYAHYDTAFEDAVMKSYIVDESTVNVENEYCTGFRSVYSEPLTCDNRTWAGGPCLMDKTFQVKNSADSPTMIFLAVAGCGMQGITMWNVSVDNSLYPEENGVPSEERTSVCGTRGTSLYQRCFSDQGGSCLIQNPTKFSSTFVPVQQISKTTMAIVCTAFVGATVLGMVLIKMNQARHKRHRQRRQLDAMTQHFYDRSGLGPNGQGDALRSPPTIEAMTGHVPISGGIQ